MNNSLLTENLNATSFECLKMFIGSCQGGVVRKLMVLFLVLLVLTEFLDGMTQQNRVNLTHLCNDTEHNY